MCAGKKQVQIVRLDSHPKLKSSQQVSFLLGNGLIRMQNACSFCNGPLEKRYHLCLDRPFAQATGSKHNTMLSASGSGMVFNMVPNGKLLLVSRTWENDFISQRKYICYENHFMGEQEPKVLKVALTTATFHVAFLIFFLSISKMKDLGTFSLYVIFQIDIKNQTQHISLV